MIELGNTLPNATFKTLGIDGVTNLSTDDIFKDKTVALFAVPGAFTPTCHLRHLPSYREHGSALKSKGVDIIVVVSVNDPFVMDAWRKASDIGDEILFLSDYDAAFTKSIGMEIDAARSGLGIRSNRYDMVVKDGKVTVLQTEDTQKDENLSNAESILKEL
ncbi:peroxiredoxin [Flexibacterium corallicola]|uniref:peroxiredoxin n=1 Tax=Flexibacterium corallicola TaxID=3037259 RepID=UPI00286F1A7D|nr:peroxiredoxin [Pseudovibrio sp. M1P-2-3]